MKAPIRIVPSPDDGKKLAVNCAEAGTVRTSMPALSTCCARSRSADSPLGIAVPDSRDVFSANMNDGTIWVIDIERGVVTRTIEAGGKPDGTVYLPR